MNHNRPRYTLLYIILFLLFSHLPISSKNDSIKQARIEQVEELLKVIQDRTNSFDPKLGISAADEALRISEDIGYNRGIIKSYYVKSFAYYFLGDFKQSLQYASKIESVHAKSKYSYYITLMHQMKGTVYSNVGLEELSKQEFLKGVASSKDIKNENYKHLISAQIYSGLAKLYSLNDDISKIDTFDYYIDKADVAIKSVSPGFEYIYYPEYMILKIKKYMREQKADSARIYTHTLLEQWTGNRYLDQPRIFATVGDYYVYAQQLDSAQYYYNYAMLRAQKTGITNHLPELYKSISQFHLNSNREDSAIYYYRLYVDADNQLSQNMLYSSEEIVRTVLADANKAHSIKAIRRVAVISFLFLTGVSTMAYFTIKKRHNHLVSKLNQESSIIDKQLNTSFDDIVDLAKRNSPLFITRFQEVYATFWNKLITTHPNLSASELHLCAMTYLNFSTQQIADYSYLQVRSVQTRRSRLRRKIDLPPDVDFTEYIKTLS